MGKYRKETFSRLLPRNWRGGCRRNALSVRFSESSSRESRIDELLDSVFEKDKPCIKKHAKRIIDETRGRKKGKWNESTWSKVLVDETHRNPSHYNGKSFRRRFRVPYEIFVKICDLCRTAKDPEDARLPWFNKAVVDCCGQPTVPLELLVLCCLRILGRGMCLDGINELTNISMECVRQFFHKFCKLFASVYFPIYCAPPETPQEINKVLQEYAMLGYPGCIGSADVVHIAWDRAPHLLRWKYVGKEGYPTVAYEVVCTHTRKIIACSKGFAGADPDKTIVQYDAFIQSIKNKVKYADVEFSVVNEAGEEEFLKGLYLIVDNGYPKWCCLQNPEKWTTDVDVIAWSRQLESVRKDIECTFGILKGRFRILKIPVLFQSQAIVDNIFKTCCVLHNLILCHDGLDSRWEDGMDWDGVDGYHDFQDIGRVIEIKKGTGKGKDWVKSLKVRVDATLDFTQSNNYVFPSEAISDISKGAHANLREKLVKNFSYRFKHNQLTWF